MLRLMEEGRRPATALDMAQLDALTVALGQEQRLIHELADVLERQRAGVATDDTAVIDDSVRALTRTLLMLDDARRQRTGLVEQLTGASDLPLASLEARIGHQLPDRLVAMREAVREAAERASREVRVNQNVLRRAIESGDAYLQALFSSSGDTTPVYVPGPRGAEPRHGLLLNLTA